MVSGDPGAAHSDYDGWPDYCDNCPADPNPDQTDANPFDGGNGTYEGDACEPDTDGDGIPDVYDGCPSVPEPRFFNSIGDLASRPNSNSVVERRDDELSVADACDQGPTPMLRFRDRQVALTTAPTEFLNTRFDVFGQANHPGVVTGSGASPTDNRSWQATGFRSCQCDDARSGSELALDRCTWAFGGGPCPIDHEDHDELPATTPWRAMTMEFDPGTPLLNDPRTPGMPLVTGGEVPLRYFDAVLRDPRDAIPFQRGGATWDWTANFAGLPNNPIENLPTTIFFTSRRRGRAVVWASSRRELAASERPGSDGFPDCDGACDDPVRGNDYRSSYAPLTLSAEVESSTSVALPYRAVFERMDFARLPDMRMLCPTCTERWPPAMYAPDCGQGVPCALIPMPSDNEQPWHYDLSESDMPPELLQIAANPNLSGVAAAPTTAFVPGVEIPRAIFFDETGAVFTWLYRKDEELYFGGPSGPFRVPGFRADRLQRLHVDPRSSVVTHFEGTSTYDGESTFWQVGPEMLRRTVITGPTVLPSDVRAAAVHETRRYAVLASACSAGSNCEQGVRLYVVDLALGTAIDLNAQSSQPAFPVSGEFTADLVPIQLTSTTSQFALVVGRHTVGDTKVVILETSATGGLNEVASATLSGGHLHSRVTVGERGLSFAIRGPTTDRPAGIRWEELNPPGAPFLPTMF